MHVHQQQALHQSQHGTIRSLPGQRDGRQDQDFLLPHELFANGIALVSADHRRGGVSGSSVAAALHIYREARSAGQ